MMDSTTKAMANRSIRTIRTELEFLADSSLLNPSQLSAIIAMLPDPSSVSSAIQPPTAAFANTSVSEKQPINHHARTPSPAPPPAYGAIPSIATASALFAYNPSDTGDLALLPNDRIQLFEYMNADWAKGRNERTGLEGIFPRSYVKILDEKSNGQMMAQPPPPPSNYGNMPLAVSQGGAGGGGDGRSKFDENGKKFGKKLGNAAIFGAGATIGSSIVNGIL